MSENNFMNKTEQIDKNIKEGEKAEKENIKSENEKKDETTKENNIIGYIYVEQYEKIGEERRIRKSFKERLINSQKDNEDDIKDCDIFINDNKIDFDYNYIFPNYGVFKIKYVFKKLLKSTNFMFYDCSSLISLNFSNFKTDNIADAYCMFNNCHSLISLDLSNFKT